MTSHSNNLISVHVSCSNNPSQSPRYLRWGTATFQRWPSKPISRRNHSSMSNWLQGRSYYRCRLKPPRTRSIIMFYIFFFRGLIQTKEMNVLKIPITFTPRECTKYEENVLFDINGLHKIEVRFTGEGVQLKLELDKSEDQNIDFGVYTIG